VREHALRVIRLLIRGAGTGQTRNSTRVSNSSLIDGSAFPPDPVLPVSDVSLNPLDESFALQSVQTPSSMTPTQIDLSSDLVEH